MWLWSQRSYYCSFLTIVFTCVASLSWLCQQVLEYFLDDVNDFLSNIFKPFSYDETDKPLSENGHHLGVGDGCLPVLKAFLDHLVTREQDNFRNRQKENKNSVMLTTMHQVLDSFQCSTVLIINLASIPTFQNSSCIWWWHMVLDESESFHVYWLCL